MKLRPAFATATCLALPLAAPLAAHAQPVTGPYVSLEGGTSIANPVNYNYLAPQADLFGGGGGGGGVAAPDVEAAALPPGPIGKFQLRPSYVGVGAVGYGFGDGFRVEIVAIFCATPSIVTMPMATILALAMGRVHSAARTLSDLCWMCCTT